uniref:Uncharacterized protein n=1 Tax=Opuntia streptacantha TaxID=393608 RepID=A0A7C9FER9_OPUST
MTRMCAPTSMNQNSIERIFQITLIRSTDKRFQIQCRTKLNFLVNLLPTKVRTKTLQMNRKSIWCFVNCKLFECPNFMLAPFTLVLSLSTVQLLSSSEMHKSFI